MYIHLHSTYINMHCTLYYSVIEEEKCTNQVKKLQVGAFEPPCTLCLLILFVDKYAFLMNLIQSRQAL
jgi:hypothetical protein